MTIFCQIIPNQHTIRPKQQQTFPQKNIKNNQKKQKRAEDTNPPTLSFRGMSKTKQEPPTQQATPQPTLSFRATSKTRFYLALAEATSPPTLSFRGMSKTKQEPHHPLCHCERRRRRDSNLLRSRQHTPNNPKIKTIKKSKE